MAKRSKKKLPTLPAIKRKLFKLTSEICRKKAKDTCEMCGLKKGDLHNGKPQRVECHHLFSRAIKNSPLKFDPKAVICLCTRDHKTGPLSAHKNGLYFAEWLRTNKPDQYQYILDHHEDVVNLDSREVLMGILEKLEEELKSIADPSDD